MGLCIYSDPDAQGDPERYALMPSIQKGKQWSWSKFRRIDVSINVRELMDTLVEVFQKDKEIHSVARHDDYPF